MCKPGTCLRTPQSGEAGSNRSGPSKQRSRRATCLAVSGLAALGGVLRPMAAVRPDVLTFQASVGCVLKLPARTSTEYQNLIHSFHISRAYLL